MNVEAPSFETGSASAPDQYSSVPGSEAAAYENLADELNNMDPTAGTSEHQPAAPGTESYYEDKADELNAMDPAGASEADPVAAAREAVANAHSGTRAEASGQTEPTQTSDAESQPHGRHAKPESSSGETAQPSDQAESKKSGGTEAAPYGRHARHEAAEDQEAPDIERIQKEFLASEMFVGDLSTEDARARLILEDSETSLLAGTKSTVENLDDIARKSAEAGGELDNNSKEYLESVEAVTAANRAEDAVADRMEALGMDEGMNLQDQIDAAKKLSEAKLRGANRRMGSDEAVRLRNEGVELNSFAKMLEENMASDSLEADTDIAANRFYEGVKALESVDGNTPDASSVQDQHDLMKRQTQFDRYTGKYLNELLDVVSAQQSAAERAGAAPDSAAQSSEQPVETEQVAGQEGDIEWPDRDLDGQEQSGAKDAEQSEAAEDAELSQEYVNQEIKKFEGKFEIPEAATMPDLSDGEQSAEAQTKTRAFFSRRFSQIRGGMSKAKEGLDKLFGQDIDAGLRLTAKEAYQAQLGNSEKVINKKIYEAAMEGDPRAEREYRKRESTRIGREVSDTAVASERTEYLNRKDAEQTARQEMKNFGRRRYLGALASQARLLGRELLTTDEDEQYKLKRQRYDQADTMPRSADDIQRQQGRNERISREEQLAWAEHRLDENLPLEGLPDPRKETVPPAARKQAAEVKTGQS